MTYRILFGGMSSAGKSTLVCSVYDVLDSRGIAVDIHELDIWSDTHDCILEYKAWSRRRKRGGPAGDDLHPEFAAAISRFTAPTEAKIVLGDLPGRRNPSWDAAADSADGAVLIFRHPQVEDVKPFFADNLVDWEPQMREWNVPVIARVQSLLPDQPTHPGRLTVRNLNRALISDRREVHDLADVIQAHAEVQSHQAQPVPPLQL